MNYVNPPVQTLNDFYHKTFHSNIYGCEIGYNIYLPPDYETSGERFPVFYHIVPMEPVCRSRNAITVFVTRPCHRQCLGYSQRAYGYRRTDPSHQQHLPDDPFT